MHDLGETRSRNRPDHRLQTPDSFVRTPLPGLTGGLAIVHAAPSMGCSFAQYTVEFGEQGGTLSSVAGLQRFAYVLEGTARLAAPEQPGAMLERSGFAYISSGRQHTIEGDPGARVVVIERAPALAGTEPQILVGDEQTVAAAPLMDDERIEVRTLLPETPAIDFAVNTMTYQPGAALPMVELHVMEHGLLMLEGGGIYRLGECWYPVRAGDFIWMAPFCPQWFGALGRRPAKYLIYKDWNRHPIEARVEAR